MVRAGNEKVGNKDMLLLVKESTAIDEAKMVAIDSDGYAVEASKVTGLFVAGCCMEYADNRNGKSGDVSVHVRRGCFVWNNDGSIHKTDILKDCYVSDSNTVTISSEGSSVAGKIIGVEDDGVVVNMI